MSSILCVPFFYNITVLRSKDRRVKGILLFLKRDKQLSNSYFQYHFNKNIVLALYTYLITIKNTNLQFFSLSLKYFEMYWYLNVVAATSAMGGPIAIEISVKLVHPAQHAIACRRGLSGWTWMDRCV